MVCAMHIKICQSSTLPHNCVNKWCQRKFLLPTKTRREISLIWARTEQTRKKNKKKKTDDNSHDLREKNSVCKRGEVKEKWNARLNIKMNSFSVVHVVDGKRWAWSAYITIDCEWRWRRQKVAVYQPYPVDKQPIIIILLIVHFPWAHARILVYLSFHIKMTCVSSATFIVGWFSPFQFCCDPIDVSRCHQQCIMSCTRYTRWWWVLDTAVGYGYDYKRKILITN